MSMALCCHPSVVNAFAETGRIDRLSGKECRSSDLEEARRQLIQYAVGGFMHLRGNSTGASNRHAQKRG